MKAALMNLAETRASIDFSNKEGITVIPSHGSRLFLRHTPDPAAFHDEVGRITPVGIAVQNILQTYTALQNQIGLANADLSWSSFGRDRALIPARDSAMTQIAAVYHNLKKHEATLALQEAQRYAVPQLAAGDVVGYLRDMEIRELFRKMPISECISFLASSAEKGLDLDLTKAVIRSPIKFAELEKIARQLWNNEIDKNDAVFAETLKLTTAAIEWAWMTLRIVVGFIQRECLVYTREELFMKVRSLGIEELFGFKADEVALRARTIKVA